ADRCLDLLIAQLERGRRPFVEFLRLVAHRVIAARLDLVEDALDGRAHLRVGFFNRAGVHSAFEKAGHGCLLDFLSLPAKRGGWLRAPASSRVGFLFARPHPAALRASTSPRGWFT